MSFLRLEYQEKAIASLRREMASGSRAPLLVAPTGSGKTFMGSGCVVSHLQKKPENKVAWFAHRSELLDQAASTLAAMGIPCGVRGNGKRERVQITSVQTACARNEMPDATFVVLDEAHHYVSDDWKRVPAAYKAAGVPVLGLTATPERQDGQGLGEVFDSLTVAAQVKELIDLERLSRFNIYAPKGDVQKGALAQSPVDAYCKLSPGRSAVVFAPNIANADAFAAGFAVMGVASTVVHGKLSDDERRSRLASFDAGAVPVIINVGVLTEGWDSPRAKVAILARKFGGVSLYLQCVGRVLRLWQGESADIIDLTGVIDKHGPPDEEREYFLEGAAVRRKGQASDVSFCRTCHSEKEAGKSCGVCGSEPSETELLKAQGIELAKFTGMRRMTADKRAATLGKWYAECDGKGRKRKSADYKYKAVFGGWPPGDVRQEAERMSKS